MHRKQPVRMFTCISMHLPTRRHQFGFLKFNLPKTYTLKKGRRHYTCSITLSVTSATMVVLTSVMMLSLTSAMELGDSDVSEACVKVVFYKNTFFGTKSHASMSCCSQRKIIGILPQLDRRKC